MAATGAETLCTDNLSKMLIPGTAAIQLLLLEIFSPEALMTIPALHTGAIRQAAGAPTPAAGLPARHTPVHHIQAEVIAAEATLQVVATAAADIAAAVAEATQVVLLPE